MDDRSKLSMRTARDGDWVLVEVGDNGPGIPEAAGAHVLGPFYTTKPGRQGHRPGAGHLLAHPSSSATTAICGSLHPATPVSRSCCRSPGAGDPRGSDQLAQVPTIGGHGPDHKGVQGDNQ
jgi:hypothetical protein